MPSTSKINSNITLVCPSLSASFTLDVQLSVTPAALQIQLLDLICASKNVAPSKIQMDPAMKVCIYITSLYIILCMLMKTVDTLKIQNDIVACHFKSLVVYIFAYNNHLDAIEIQKPIIYLFILMCIIYWHIYTIGSSET